TDARTEGGRQRDLTVAPIFADGLGGVLHQIEKDLNQLIAAARYWGQGWIVIHNDLDVASEAVGGDLLHMVEYVMDVDRLSLQRALVAENLHAVDKLADAVGLRADQLRQRAVAIGAIGLKELRRAPDAGQRILDF